MSEPIDPHGPIQPQEPVETQKPSFKWTDLLKMTAEQNPDFAEKMHYWIVKRRRQPEFHYLLSWVVATFGPAKTTEYITQILESNDVKDQLVREAMAAQNELALKAQNELALKAQNELALEAQKEMTKDTLEAQKENQ